jgi:hypothetical protein
MIFPLFFYSILLTILTITITRYLVHLLSFLQESSKGPFKLPVLPFYCLFFYKVIPITNTINIKMQFSHALIALVAAGLANAQLPDIPSCSVSRLRWTGDVLAWELSG